MSRRRPSFRIWRELAILLIFLALAGGYALLSRKPAAFFTQGPFVAVDGDTLTIDGMRLRIRGIDAPERRQLCGEGRAQWACGLEARRALAARLAGLSCEVKGQDKYRRRLARCRMPAGDLGAAMVREGLAVAYGDYEAEEAEARRARRGLWSGPFLRPEDWRKAHRRKAEMEDVPDMLDILRSWW